MQEAKTPNVAAQRDGGSGAAADIDRLSTTDQFRALNVLDGAAAEQAINVPHDRRSRVERRRNRNPLLEARGGRVDMAFDRRSRPGWLAGMRSRGEAALRSLSKLRAARREHSELAGVNPTKAPTIGAPSAQAGNQH